jgi:hypothetical protein
MWDFNRLKKCNGIYSGWRYGLVLGGTAIAVMWIVSGGIKLHNIWMFLDSVMQFNLLPHWMLGPFSVALPIAEMMIGCGLFLGAISLVFRRCMGVGRPLFWATLGLGMGFLGVFSCAMAIAIYKGLSVLCGCFGGTDLVGWGAIARNGVLIGGHFLVGWCGFVGQKESL